MNMSLATLASVEQLRTHFALINGSPEAISLLMDPALTPASFATWINTAGKRALFEQLISSPAAMAAVAASSTAMAAVAASSTAMAAVAASSTAMAAVVASSTAMAAVIASSTAMAAVVASSTAMAAVAASSTAMAAVAASSTAMDAVAASSTALSAMIKSATARTALAASSSNSVLQSTAVATAIKGTLTASSTAVFTKPVAGATQDVGGNQSYGANAAFAPDPQTSDQIFVVVTHAGSWSSGTSTTTKLKHLQNKSFDALSLLTTSQYAGNPIGPYILIGGCNYNETEDAAIIYSVFRAV